MLIVTFHNDSTGNDIVGNYDWTVLLNDKILAKGRIEDHNRLSGWMGLLKCFVNEECGGDDV